MEELGVLEREAFAEIPPRVEYRLTEKGRALADIITAIEQFGEHYLAGEARNPADSSQAAPMLDSACDSPPCR